MRAVLAFLLAAVLRLMRLTWRVTIIGPAPPYDEGPVVFCFYHGRQSGLFAHPHRRPVAVMSSLSRDGALQARILRSLGFAVVRGSSSRGGAEGLRALVSKMNEGCDAAFAVDGPRGPAGVVKPGALAAAKQAGARVVPVTFTASSEWIFEKAWDRYALPRPFSRVKIHRAPSLPPDASPALLEEALSSLAN